MGELSIHLREGFSGEPVRVLVNGAEVFQSSELKTDYSIGLAESVNVAAEAGPAEVEISAGSASLRFTVDAANGSTIRVKLKGGKLEWDQTARTPRYR